MIRKPEDLLQPSRSLRGSHDATSEPGPAPPSPCMLTRGGPMPDRIVLPARPSCPIRTFPPQLSPALGGHRTRAGHARNGPRRWHFQPVDTAERLSLFTMSWRAGSIGGGSFELLCICWWQRREPGCARPRSPPSPTARTRPRQSRMSRSKARRCVPRWAPKDRSVASMALSATAPIPRSRSAGTGPRAARYCGRRNRWAGRGSASLRGATSGRPRCTLRGYVRTDDLVGAADLSLVPPWLINRVEIYRGNAPIEADQLGIGGAIFFEPRKPKYSGALAGGMLGSFGTHSVWANASTGNARASALVGIRSEGATNDYPYVNDQGTRFDSSDDVVQNRTNADVHTTDLWVIGRTSLGTHTEGETLS